MRPRLQQDVYKNGIAVFLQDGAMILNATSFPNMEGSDNDEDDSYVPYDQRPETYIVPVVFLLILVVGVTGNGILVLTLLRHASMRNVPNTYVLSLALGDLLVRNKQSSSEKTLICIAGLSPPEKCVTA